MQTETKQLKTLEGIMSFPLQEVVRGKNIPEASYRFQLQKYLLVHTLIQEQLPHLVDHILDHRLVQFRLWDTDGKRKRITLFSDTLIF